MEIQPRKFADVFNELIRMLGLVWRPLLMPALVTSVVVAIASYLVLTASGTLDFFEITFTDPEALENFTDQQLIDLFWDLAQAVVLLTAVSAVVYGYLYLVTARSVGEATASKSTGRSIVAVAAGGLLAYVVATFLVGIGTFVGFLFLIVPGIWFANMMSMVAPVIAIEAMGPVGAIRRSFQLVQGHWWETFGFLLIIGLIGGTAAQLVQLVAIPLFLTGNVSFAFGITIALSVAAQGVIVAAIAVGASVWYLNLRARADGPFVLEIS